MATTDIRQQTHQGVLPQPPALESASADNPGVGPKRGADAAHAAPGVDHGRGERKRPHHRIVSRHEAETTFDASETGASDRPIVTAASSGAAALQPRHPKVPVVDRRGKPLMPCHPARARQLLANGRARVVSLHPFTIRLVDRTVEDSAVEGVVVKIDPGSVATGISIARTDQNGDLHGLLSVELRHRGRAIAAKLTARAALRRGRRSRTLRYRAPRFLNRATPPGWLPPSLRHRVDSTSTWVRRLRKVLPVTDIVMEKARFDTQRMTNPGIGGVQYQQGTLAGYEVRQYLLEKYRRRCVYCSAEGVPLNIDHVVPRACGGSNRVSNLVLACIPCNTAKGARPLEEFVTDPKKLARIAAELKAPLRDAAMMNATRNSLHRVLEATRLPVETGTGGRTKFNRARFGLPKSHTIDALAVGRVSGVASFPASVIMAMSTGRGTYQRTITDRFGFPRSHRPRTKEQHGFTTGDIVRATIPRGKNAGTHIGRVAVRSTGHFAITTSTRKVDGVNHKHCLRLQRGDGWNYAHRKEEGVEYRSSHDSVSSST